MNTLLKGFIGTSEKSNRCMYNFTYCCEKNKFIDICPATTSSSYIAIDNDTEDIYSVMTKDKLKGLASFNIDSINLTSLFKQENCPRHIAFHPTKNYAYVLTQKTSELSVFEYNELGNFTLKKITTTLPQKYYGVKDVTTIHVHPNGEYLYTSNRGHNSIATFKIDKTSGDVTLIDHNFTFGSSPTDFQISPDGNYIIAANEMSSSLVSFKINKASGRLSEILDSIEVPNPIYINFC